MTKLQKTTAALYATVIAASFLAVYTLHKATRLVTRICRRVASFILSHLEKRTDPALNRLISSKRFNELAVMHGLNGDDGFILENFQHIDWGDRRKQVVNEINLALNPYIESGYCMTVLARVHQIDWAKDPQISYPGIAALIRKMLDHKHYEFEERIFRARISDPDQSTNLNAFVPYFFRDKKLIEKIAEDLALPSFEADIAQLDSGGQFWESFPTHNATYEQLQDISLFYAYRLICNKVYDFGMGGLVATIAPKIADVQRRLLPQLPQPSEALIKTLREFGIHDLKEIRILSPDVAALIGHLGHFNVDLMMREMGWWQGTPILLTYKDKIANRAYLSLFRDLFPILVLDENVSPSVWHELASLTPFLGAPQTFQFKDGLAMNWNDAGAMAVVEWEKQKRGFPLRDIYDKKLIINTSIEETFSKFLEEWGIQPTDWYVCLHMRDSQTRGDRDSHGQAIRNTTIENYIDSIRFITERGGWVIRMGGNKTIPLPPMDRVIDYAHYPRQTPEMDIHLVRRAKMFIGTTSGFTYVASNFGIPSAIVNAISSIGLLWPGNTRFCLKLVKTLEGRMLTQQEVTSDRWRWSFASFETLRDAGLTVDENSSDEILETVKEVLSLAFSTAANEESPLIKNWRSQVGTESFYGGAVPSTYFLEKYKYQFLND
jgi:putative glycosyltransferase (TIGR04372 family)